MEKVEGMADGNVEEDQGVSTVFGNGGGKVVLRINVELREGGVHAIEFAVEAGEIGVGVPGREGVTWRAIDIRYYSSPGRNHAENN